MKNPMFTKCHYRWIAGVLFSAMPRGANVDLYYNWRIICASFSDNFCVDNPKFDPDKFLTACGFEDRK